MFGQLTNALQLHQSNFSLIILLFRKIARGSELGLHSFA